jgi:ABC-2 type transport system permease protein
MKKTLIVAQSEFGTLVRTKAFIISVMIMPVVIAAAIALIKMTEDAEDLKERRFAYVDYSGVVGPMLQAAKHEQFRPVEVKPEGRTPEQLQLELSDRVRREELFAFIEIPATIVDPASAAQVRYHSDHPSYESLPRWLRMVVDRAVENERFRTAGIDRATVERLTQPAPFEELGLVERDRTGEVKEAEQVDPVRAMVLPGVFLMLMYMSVMSSAPQLLNSVIEEKMSRISEVLIASVTPFQLMMGKLIGSALVSVLLALIYVAGGLAVAWYFGYLSVITPGLLFTFALFLLLATFIFGSIFVAIGAACTDLKDSQNMMTPVMLLVMFPMFTWAAVLRAPDSTLAIALSLIPTAAPFLMMLRIALQPGPPFWQIALSVALMLLTTIAAVWAAGRIFRTGLLMQGKSATIPEMIRWVRAG